ncbi:hypothetical protein HDU93_000088 [Gonapodya sp. JEL0774]|nr:hypothetical protein HDU93_000088 [Gonapodya sp. JEL0774]
MSKVYGSPACKTTPNQHPSLLQFLVKYANTTPQRQLIEKQLSSNPSYPVGTRRADGTRVFFFERDYVRLNRVATESTTVKRAATGGGGSSGGHKGNLTFNVAFSSTSSSASSSLPPRTSMPRARRAPARIDTSTPNSPSSATASASGSMYSASGFGSYIPGDLPSPTQRPDLDSDTVVAVSLGVHRRRGSIVSAGGVGVRRKSVYEEVMEQTGKGEDMQGVQLSHTIHERKMAESVFSGWGAGYGNTDNAGVVASVTKENGSRKKARVGGGSGSKSEEHTGRDSPYGGKRAGGRSDDTDDDSFLVRRSQSHLGSFQGQIPPQRKTQHSSGTGGTGRKERGKEGERESTSGVSRLPPLPPTNAHKLLDELIGRVRISIRVESKHRLALSEKATKAREAFDAAERHKKDLESARERLTNVEKELKSAREVAVIWRAAFEKAGADGVEEIGELEMNGAIAAAELERAAKTESYWSREMKESENRVHELVSLLESANADMSSLERAEMEEVAIVDGQVEVVNGMLDRMAEEVAKLKSEREVRNREWADEKDARFRECDRIREAAKENDFVPESVSELATSVRGDLNATEMSMAGSEMDLDGKLDLDVTRTGKDTAGHSSVNGADTRLMLHQVDSAVAMVQDGDCDLPQPMDTERADASLDRAVVKDGRVDGSCLFEFDAGMGGAQ